MSVGVKYEMAEIIFGEIHEDLKKYTGSYGNNDRFLDEVLK